MYQSYMLASALAAIPMVSARCNNIEFTLDGLKLVEDANITAEEGYSTGGRQLIVSEVVNCTEEAGHTEPCGFHHYPMVIEMQPSINETVNDRKQIFQLIREKAAPATALMTNLNETVYWNYTVPNATIPQGVEANYNLAPYLQCWIGTLRDCDDKDRAVDGKNITVCGAPWEQGTEGLPVDQQQYQGKTFNFFGEFKNESYPSEPQKPASEFDWKAYENEIKEDNAETGDAGHLQGLAKNSVLAFGVACAALAFL